MVLSTSSNDEESTEEPTGIAYGTTDEEFIDSDRTDSNMMQGPALAHILVYKSLLISLKSDFNSS